MDAKQPSRIVWEGSAWRLRVREVVRPDGATEEKGTIEHPGAVVLVPLTDEDKLLLLRQYRPALEQTILELPAGTRRWDEPWLACAQRELREETGYSAESFTLLGKIWPAPGLSNELMALYLARGLARAPLATDFDEIIEVQPTPFADAVRLAHDGGLQDAKSIIGVLRAARFLARDGD